MSVRTTVFRWPRFPMLILLFDCFLGGTNTDAVLACCNENSVEKPTIIASSKCSTTPDADSGIRSAIDQVISAAAVERQHVISVNVGTTHFINAVVQGDRCNLEPVAVLRLCGPFCREVRPFIDFPPSLRNIVEGYSGYLKGGLESKYFQNTLTTAEQI